MVQRCYNPTNNKYHLYGARGIRVCEFLRASPRNLIDLIGEKPKGWSIDRIESKGFYTCGQCPECLRCGYPMNVRWATVIQQNRNRSSNLMITHEGKTQCLAQWAKEKGIHISTLRNRLHRGQDLFGPVYFGPHTEKSKQRPRALDQPSQPT